MFVKRMNVLIFLSISLISFVVNAQSDEEIIQSIFKEELTNGKAYSNLRDLCKGVGHRLSGSTAAEKAVEWGKATLKKIGADSVYLQEVVVPHWERGTKEFAEITFNGYKKEMAVCALGGSVGTGANGITAEVIEVFGIEELEKMGRDRIEGKIIFLTDL